MKNDEYMVTIKATTHNALLEAEATLAALEAAGVDNWDGYGYAMELLEGQE